jgi:hypothetical protein
MASAFRQATRVFIDQQLSPAARSARLADAAKAGVAELVASGRASPYYRRFVDGQEGAQESSVKPNGGVILYQFSYVAETVAFAIAFLRGRSPVGSGRYRDGFVVSVDGRPIPAAQLQPRSIPLDAEIIIYNPLPYSRKIDVQFAGKRKLRFSVPPNIFDDCARAIRARYGNTATAKRVYSVTFPGQYIRKTGKGRTRGAGSPVQSPAIIITPAG